MAVDWGYYDNERFEKLDKLYLPPRGEGETKATQIVTAVNKLVYKWYNDGDVFDNTYILDGWCNDLSDYANWLHYYTTEKVQDILNKIKECDTDSDYEDLLKELADELLQEDYLAEQHKIKKEKSIYDCKGKYNFIELTENDNYY